MIDREYFLVERLPVLNFRVSRSEPEEMRRYRHSRQKDRMHRFRNRKKRDMFHETESVFLVH